MPQAHNTMQQFLVLISLLSSCQAFAVSGWGPSRASSALESTTNQQQHHQTTVQHPEKNNKIKTCDLLSLDSIRDTLIRQEETIIFALIERSQFRNNEICYKRGGFGDLGLPMGSTPVDDDTELSFLEYFLVGTVCSCEKVIFECFIHVLRFCYYLRKFFTAAYGGTHHQKSIPFIQKDFLRDPWMHYLCWTIHRISCRESVVPT